ncbi:Protein F37C4.5 [Leucoagaricus sp. SymC.cos]|nr:Protein F37C4.5 [Leucoagaricus sp. SymC.cos]
MQVIPIVAAEHPVKSVVILKSSKAEVVRTFNIALQAGQNKLVISQLPSTIDSQSVRVAGLNFSGSNTTFLSDVVCSTSEAAEDASKAIIHALEVQKNTLTHEKRVLDTQADVLVKYANSLTGEHANPKVMNNFLGTFVEHGKSNIHAIAKIEAETEAINKQIEAERKKASLVKGTANTELTAVITADTDTNVELKVTYIVNETKWSPTYELHAVTGDDGQPSRTVSLHYRARITQSTGEDWADAALTLSTAATDAIIQQIPKLEPVKVRVEYRPQDKGPLLPPLPSHPAPAVPATATTTPQATSIFGQPAPPSAFGQPAPPSTFGQQVQPSIFGSTTTSAPNPSQPSTESVFRQTSAQPLPEEVDEESANESLRTVDEPAKLVTQTPMALAYSVRGKSSIPSDGKEHIVTIAVLDFETDVDYVSVPRVDPRVYLQCQVKNNSEYRLLSGPVSIILDDSYVSKTTISDVNRNDVFNFTLGDDPSVIISYSRLSKTIKEGSGSFADVVNLTTYTTTINVQNKHAFSIENLIIKDAIPICYDSRVRVILRKPKELVKVKEDVLVKVSQSEEMKDKGKEAEAEAEGEAEEVDEEDEKALKVKWTKEKDGLYEYMWRVDPDDRIEMKTVFEMRASVDLSCSFMENIPRFGFGAK